MENIDDSNEVARAAVAAAAAGSHLAALMAYKKYCAMREGAGARKLRYDIYRHTQSGEDRNDLRTRWGCDRVFQDTWDEGLQ